MSKNKNVLISGSLLAAISVIILLLSIFPARGNKGHNPWKKINKKRNHLDHTPFFKGKKFNNGQEVTRACLECHGNAAKEVMKTVHFKFTGDPVDIPGKKGKFEIGKRNLINNFCIGIRGNWSSCTKCHAGYGWKDASFDFNKEENVDCLVCHDWSGTYIKDKAGIPAKKVNLTTVAQKVGYPKRDNCSVCHINGGGGMGVKHGDLDISLINASPNVDVHMGKHNMLCIDCHRAKNHRIMGTAFSVSVNHKNGFGCMDCHQGHVHTNNDITPHEKTLACETCHIPKIAKRAPTKTHWDWSKAGNNMRKNDVHRYLKIKGEFVYNQNINPEYRWFNMEMKRYLLGDKIDPGKVTDINTPQGRISDWNSRIFPFKIHRAIQPYDRGNNYLLSPVTSGKGGFWHEFNWDKAFRLGEKATGLKYSGKYGFTRTDMYWPIEHMVTPRSQALTCDNCHENGSRIDWKALGYPGDPMNEGGRGDIAKMEGGQKDE